MSEKMEKGSASSGLKELKYEDVLAKTKEYFNANNPQDGWYFIWRRNFSRFNFYYNKVKLFYATIEYGAYTLFLYIDGRIIDFLDFLPQIEDKDIVYENYDTYGDWGKTKIIKQFLINLAKVIV